ncbi:MAG: DUF721 domain-containing protein [Bacteroidia bacterium]
MYNNNQVTLKDAINQLLDSYKLKSKMKTIEIEKKWRSLMGPMIANHTKDIFLKQGVLHIRFDSSPLKQEMQMMKSKTILHLNENLGEAVVKDIRLL